MIAGMGMGMGMGRGGRGGVRGLGRRCSMVGGEKGGEGREGFDDVMI